MSAREQEIIEHEALTACLEAFKQIRSHCWPFPLNNDSGQPLSMEKIDKAYRLALAAITSSNSLVRGLDQSNLVKMPSNVDERVSMTAPGAEKVDAVAVDLRIDRSKHDVEPAVSALPHDVAPAEEGHRTAALHSQDDKTHE